MSHRHVKGGGKPPDVLQEGAASTPHVELSLGILGRQERGKCSGLGRPGPNERQGCQREAWPSWQCYAGKTAMNDHRHLIPLSEVQPEELSWLWPDRIPLKMITLLEGDPAHGRSALTYDIAARCTRGHAMYNCCETTSPAGVVLLQAEDSLGSTVLPNLQAAGADISRVVVYDRTRFRDEPLMLPDDIALLANAVADVQARLVVVDPVNAFLSANANSDQQVRKALKPLAAFAEQSGVAVLLVRHLTKSGPRNPLYRGAGSIA